MGLWLFRWPEVGNLQAESFAAGARVHRKLRGAFSVREAWVREIRDPVELQVSHAASVNSLAGLFTTAHQQP